jgi:hypothetical protein
MARTATAFRLSRSATWLLLTTLFLAVAEPVLAAPNAPSPLPGAQLRMTIGKRTTLVYEPRTLAPAQPMVVQPTAAAPSIGLEFKGSANPAAGVSSLLRVQLTTDAAVHFRPRRGGLAISYRAQF